AFVGGDNAPESMRGRADTERTLQGWRCLACGHAEVSARDVESAIAEDLVPMMMFQACASQSLRMLVETILSLNIPGMEEDRHQIIAAATASGIKVADRDGWMRPCPNCGGDDTAVYRWRFVSAPSAHLVPSDNNMPMRRLSSKRKKP